MSGEYWYSVGGERFGPIAAEALRQMIRSGQVSGQALAWREGMSAWVPVASHPELTSGVHVPPPIPGAAPNDGGLGTLVPYRNGAALAAYYCGVFSLIPILGALLGIIAFVLGIVGLKFVRRNPTAKGTVHAWVGIILGGFMCLLHAGVIVAAVIAASSR